MEKRLYNRGYHIEHKRTFQTNKTGESTKPDEVFEDPALDETNDNFLSEEAFLTPETDETADVQDSTVVLAPDRIVKDTVYIYDDYGSNIKRKQRNLLLTGIPAVVFGAISFRSLAMAGASGANVGGFFVFGSLGLALGIIAAILLLAFIIILCVPANPGEVRYEAKEDPQLSRGENTALTICLVVFGLIGLGFLAANVF